MLCIGPAIAWALIPLLTSPFAATIFEPYGIYVLYVWLGGTAIVSTLGLAVYVSLKRAAAKAPAQKTVKADARAAVSIPTSPSE